MPYPNEHSCRLREPEGLDIVGSGERKTDGKTYRVIFGKPKGGDGSVEQAYRYPIESWAEAEARKHCEAHDGKFHPATREANVDPLPLRFFASLQSWEEKDGRHLATFYLMDTSVNLNNWRVTHEALEKALPGLLGKPLSAKPGYRVDHANSPLDVGTFVQVGKPDGYAIGVAEITDELAWGKIKNREWGPVSCEITAKKVTCSLCGKDILAEPCEHVLSRQAHEVISEFGFDRFALVSEPAYPMAGMLFAAGRSAGAIPFQEGRKAPEFHASQSPRGDEPKGALNPEVKEGGKRVTDNEIAELQKKLDAVTAENQTLKTEQDKIKTENQNLKAQLDQIKEERHLEKVSEVVDLRLQAGLATDRNAETEKLKELDDKTLGIMRGDVAAFIAEKERITRVAGPKAKFTAGAEDEVQKKIEETRERFFGHRSSPPKGGND